MGRAGRAAGWRLTLGSFGAALLLAGHAGAARAEQVDVSGPVEGADVDGTISLSINRDDGSVTGRIEMDVRFDCRGKTRTEHHVMDVTKGRLDGDRLVATALYNDGSRSGLPKDELSRCKSAYETYQTREDSKRIVGFVDFDGGVAAGSVGEYRPTVFWRIEWPTEPVPAPTLADPLPADPASPTESTTPVETPEQAESGESREPEAGE